MIYIGAKVGGIGLGIYGMVGVCVLVFVFGLKPGAIISEALLGDRSIGMTEIMGARWAVLAFLMGVPPMVLLVNHSFQLAGFITTFVSIGVGYLLVTLLY